MPKPQRSRQASERPPDRGAKRFARVEFRFLGDEDAVYEFGTVIVREAEMVLELGQPYTTPYLLIGRKVGTHYSAIEANAPRGVTAVRAAWAKVGSSYVGTWVEDGEDWLFSFSLP